MTLKYTTKAAIEKAFKNGKIDRAEKNARLKGLRKGWDEDKTLRRANARRYAKFFGLAALREFGDDIASGVGKVVGRRR